MTLCNGYTIVAEKDASGNIIGYLVKLNGVLVHRAASLIAAQNWIFMQSDENGYADDDECADQNKDDSSPKG